MLVIALASEGPPASFREKLREGAIGRRFFGTVLPVKGLMLRPIWVLGALMSLGAGCSARSDAGLRPPDGNVQGSTKPKTSSSTAGKNSNSSSPTSEQTSSPGATTERGGASSTSNPASGTSQESTAPTGTSSSASSSASTATTGSKDPGTGTSTDPRPCGHAPAHTCSKAINCGGWARCGGTHRFDELGCQRSDCVDDSQCAAGERCYRALDFGGCASSNVICNDLADGSCECTVTDDCAGSYCVPESEYPG